jgi:hypothetical protein
MVSLMAKSLKANGPDQLQGNPQAPIRLGILVDDDLVPHYVNTLLSELSLRPDMELAAVIVHRRSRSAGLSADHRVPAATPVGLVSLDRIAARAALFFVTGIEALVLSLRNQASHPLRHEPIRYPSASVVRITPLCADVASHCQYSQSDLRLLMGLALDFLVVESERDPALCARASLARFGAIRMRFGEAPTIPRDQTGFKEVCRRDPASKFRILSLHGHGDTPIFAGAFQSRPSLVDNRNELIRKAYPYLGQAIAALFARLSCGRPAHSVSIESPYKTAIDSQVSTRELFGSLLPRIDRIMRDVLNVLLGRKEYWRIAWYRGRWQEVGTAEFKVAENPGGGFLADPFVVTREGRHLCFVEEYHYRKGRGVVSALELTGASTVMLGSAIEEPFHLSFPFLFEYESRLYLCPESSEAGQIRVYECLEFPLRWKLCSVLMDKVRAVDTMLVEHDGRWWMFTNIDPQGSNDFESRMYLFWSDSPLSTVWEPHPQNPVVFDPQCARNAGLLTRDGELFRCAQRQGFAQYGEAISIRKIVELTTEHYAEQLHLAVEPEKYGARGTHHMHHDNVFVVRDECHMVRPARSFPLHS